MTTITITAGACRDRSARSVTRDEPRAQPAAPPEPSGELSRRLPHPEVLGWSMSRPAREIGRDQLADLVNGAAGDYLRFGFTAAAAAEYENDQVEESSIRIELYQLGSQLDAFGALAREITARDDPATAEAPGVLEIREAGLIGPGRLTFFRGPLLIRLYYQDASPTVTEESLDTATREHLPPLARELARALPGSSELPDELEQLPRTRQVRRSEQYHPQHLLGLEFLGRGISSLYGDPGPRLTLGVPLDANAEATFSTIEQRLTGVTAVEELGDQAARGRLDDDEVWIARRGDTLAIATYPSADRSPRSSVVTDVLTEALDPSEPTAEQADPRPWRRANKRTADR